MDTLADIDNSHNRRADRFGGLYARVDKEYLMRFCKMPGTTVKHMMTDNATKKYTGVPMPRPPIFP